MEEDGQRGPWYRWGRTHSEIVPRRQSARPRVRDRAGKEVSLESWQALRDGNLAIKREPNKIRLKVVDDAGSIWNSTC